MKRPAVFLDRDGTINEEVGYIYEPQDLRLIPGAAGAIHRLNEAGILAILTTNQSGPARGYYPESHIETLHQRLNDLLLEEGALLDALYYCPHLPDGVNPRYAIPCQCRKPERGMIDQALAAHDIDLPRSYVIGDKATDVEFGHKVGCKSVLLLTGYGKQVLAGTYQWKVEPDFVATDLSAAIDWLLEDLMRAS